LSNFFFPTDFVIFEQGHVKKTAEENEKY